MKQIIALRTHYSNCWCCSWVQAKWPTKHSRTENEATYTCRLKQPSRFCKWWFFISSTIKYLIKTIIILGTNHWEIYGDRDVILVSLDHEILKYIYKINDCYEMISFPIATWISVYTHYWNQSTWKCNYNIFVCTGIYKTCHCFWYLLATSLMYSSSWSKYLS